MQKRLAGWACLAIGIGIIVGAFGAHKMQEILNAKQLVSMQNSLSPFQQLFVTGFTIALACWDCLP